MVLEAVGTIIALLGLLGTIAGLVFALGKRDARLDVLEGRCREEWGRNSDQHKDFYQTSDKVIALATTLEEVSRRLGQIETNLMEILRRMPKGDGV